MLPADRRLPGERYLYGFYNDFDRGTPFTPEDLAAIEVRMKELARADEAVTRRVLPRVPHQAIATAARKLTQVKNAFAVCECSLPMP